MSFLKSTFKPPQYCRFAARLLILTKRPAFDIYSHTLTVAFCLKERLARLQKKTRLEQERRQLYYYEPESVLADLGVTRDQLKQACMPMPDPLPPIKQAEHADILAFPSQLPVSTAAKTKTPGLDETAPKPGDIPRCKTG